MTSDSNNNTPKIRVKPRVRMVIFVREETEKALDAFKIIYGSTPGEIMDAMVHSLRTARAEKIQWCVTGKRCQFNQPFPETELI